MVSIKTAERKVCVSYIYNHLSIRYFISRNIKVKAISSPSSKFDRNADFNELSVLFNYFI